MKPAKKKASARPSVKFRDLKSNKNPKGGAVDAFLKLDKTTPKFSWIS
jgi:hypothetical protein